MMNRLKTRPFIFFGTLFILVIVVIAFVFVPAIVPTGGGMGDFTFGYYNRVPIRMVSGNFFHQAQQSLTQQNQHLLSANPDNTWLVRQIWRMAFEETVVYMGIQDEVRRAGLIVPDHVVNREVARQFQVNGVFDVHRYRAMDSATRMSIWRQTQEGIAAGNYVSDLNSLRISSNEISFIGSMASPRRSFSVAIFPLDSYPDSQVLAHAQANPSPFRVTRLSRIFVNSEWEARQVLDMVRDGVTTFEEAAQNHSQDWFSGAGGDMGMRMAYEFVSEIPDAQGRESVIDLAQGELSGIVSVSLGWGMTGWAFFRAEEAVQPPDSTDPAQVERIRNHIMTNVRGMVEDWVIGEAQAFSDQVRARGFEEVAAEGNILRRNFGPIPVNFGDSVLFSAISTAGVPEIQHAGSNTFFWDAAFTTPLMTPSNPVVIDDNVMILFPLEESYADEFDVGLIESFYPSRVMEYITTAYRSYFLNSQRLVDRFDETFWRLWR